MSKDDQESSDEIQLISDESGIAVIGKPNAVERFLESKGLLALSEQMSVKQLGPILNAAAGITEKIAETAENSGRYLKLTKESAELRKKLDLMPTKKKGISHVMIGKPGEVHKWLQAEDGLTAQITSPAILTGIAGFMAQAARQQEAKELKELLVRMDLKLDDVRRGQRDEILSRMDGVALAIQQALAIREHGGDRDTAWRKIETESGTIGEVQSAALRKLQALADDVTAKQRHGALAKSMEQTEQEAGVWIAVLARCFELQAEFEVLELEHVAINEPDKLEGHREGLEADSISRRKVMSEKTTHLLEKLNSAGEVAAENILLHANAARKTVTAIEAVNEAVADLHRPLEIETDQRVVELTPWKKALRDKTQLKNASKEVGQATLAGAVAAGVGALSLIAMKNKANDA